jgi:Domain of unknown function (DUF6265)
MTRPKIRTATIPALGALLAGMVGGAPARQPIRAGARQSDLNKAAAPAANPVQSPKATLADFAWLEGRWQGVWGPRMAEQEWVGPKAGVMLGVFRLIENDKTLVIELFTLLEKQDRIEFRFRHFTPDLHPWEQAGSTVLNLATLDPPKAMFENPVDGQPKRETLTRIDAATYVLRSEIVPSAGESQVTEITYHRQK